MDRRGAPSGASVEWPPVRACVVIPCFDHPKTVEAVVRGALEHGAPVIVVDDGSGEPTREALGRLDGVRVLRHDRNRGKGAALRTGFDAARAEGCTHAVTIDADGQHPTREIPRLLDAARRDESEIA